MKNLYIIIVIAALINSCSEEKDSDLKASDRIFDRAHLLSTEQTDSLFELIKSVDEELGPQIAIVTTDSLSGESIAKFSQEQAGLLNLGRKGLDDGILISVALNERQIRIDVGLGLTHIINGQTQATIISVTIAPQFKIKRYYEGLRTAVLQIKTILEENRRSIGEH